MNPMWRCLDCGAPLEDRESMCNNRYCTGSIETQSGGPDYYKMALGVLDLDALAEADEYRRCVDRTITQRKQMNLKDWRDRLMRDSR